MLECLTSNIFHCVFDVGGPFHDVTKPPKETQFLIFYFHKRLDTTNVVNIFCNMPSIIRYAFQIRYYSENSIKYKMNIHVQTFEKNECVIYNRKIETEIFMA